MKKLVLLGCLSVLALGRQATTLDEMTLDAYSIDNSGSVCHLSGHVVIKTNAMTIRTEKADVSKDTHIVKTYGAATFELY